MILITNDDGVDAPGLSALVTGLSGLDDVMVAAPMRDMSGSGAAIGPLDWDAVEVEPRTVAGCAAWAVDCPPAMIVLLADSGAFGPRPHFVASGINAGSNTGRAVLHSGTVGAAQTAAQLGLPALAVSLDGSHRYESAAAAARWMIGVSDPTAPPVAFNMNVPDVPIEQISGWRVTRLARGGSVGVGFEGQPPGRMRLRLTGQAHDEGVETDTGALADGYVTLSVIHGPAETRLSAPLWPSLMSIAGA